MDLKEQKFGVEVEFTGISRLKAGSILRDYLGGELHSYGLNSSNLNYFVKAPDDREWRIVFDSSVISQKINANNEKIRAGNVYKVELVTPICTYEDIEKIQEIVRLFREKGAFVNESCGIHIHINANPFDASKLRNLVNMMASKENLIYRALKVSKKRENVYCKKVDKEFLINLNNKKIKTMEELKKLWYDGRSRQHIHYDSSRYKCLNLHSVFNKGTIEIRAFNSSIHAGKLKAYIQLCLAMTAKAHSLKFASPKETITKNEKYNFRVWLVSLGMIGDEFKTARKHLLDHLDGNIAWKDPAQAERQKERMRLKNRENSEEQGINGEIVEQEETNTMQINTM